LQEDKISALVKAANVDVEAFWPSLFAKLLQKVSVDDIVKGMSAAPTGGAPAAAAPAAGAAPAEEEVRLRTLGSGDAWIEAVGDAVEQLCCCCHGGDRVPVRGRANWGVVLCVLILTQSFCVCRPCHFKILLVVLYRRRRRRRLRSRMRTWALGCSTKRFLF